ncbi:unnamed protein product, partial [Hapterophycus canaliculatus]
MSHYGYENPRVQHLGEGTEMALPPGWEAQVLPGGRVMYVDHTTQTTHWEPPTM